MTNTIPGFLENIIYPEEAELRKAQVGWGLRGREEVENPMGALGSNLLRGSRLRRTYLKGEQGWRGSSPDTGCGYASTGIMAKPLWQRRQATWGLKMSVCWPYSNQEVRVDCVGDRFGWSISVEWGNFTKRRERQLRGRTLNNRKLMGKSERLKTGKT